MTAEALPLHADWLRPDWSVDHVGAFMTTRQGGVGRPPFESFNVRDGIGDEAATVATHRTTLGRIAGAVPVFLEQVHGAAVVRLRAADARPGAPVHRADAAITTELGIACTVQVADCLPVLLAAPGGRGVGAAHAGWRGLAGGVLEASVAALCQATGCAPAELAAWLGPCIGPTRFEVGSDVRAAFLAIPRPALARSTADAAGADRFTPLSGGQWLADLPGLARDRLRGIGVTAIYGGTGCTVLEASRFFSYRRDRITGRMAALVWIERGLRSG